MYYGFDIGGTKIAFAVYDDALTLCHEERVSTPGNDYPALQQLVRERVEAADARFGVKGAVGIGFPGILNRLDGSIVAANLPAIWGRIWPNCWADRSRSTMTPTVSSGRKCIRGPQTVLAAPSASP